MLGLSLFAVQRVICNAARARNSQQYAPADSCKPTSLAAAAATAAARRAWWALHPSACSC